MEFFSEGAVEVPKCLSYELVGRIVLRELLTRNL